MHSVTSSVTIQRNVSCLLTVSLTEQRCNNCCTLYRHLMLTRRFGVVKNSMLVSSPLKTQFTQFWSSLSQFDAYHIKEGLSKPEYLMSLLHLLARSQRTPDK